MYQVAITKGALTETERVVMVFPAYEDMYTAAAAAYSLSEMLEDGFEVLLARRDYPDRFRMVKGQNIDYGVYMTAVFDAWGQR